MSKKDDCMEEKPGWYNGQFLDEVGFCCDFICRYPMVCVGGKFFSKEGRIHDENSIKKQIYEMLRPYLKVGLAKKCSNLLEMLRMKKYEKYFKTVDTKQKALEAENEKLTADLKKSQQKSTLKRLQEARLQNDYERVKGILDRIPPEIIRAYTHGTKNKEVHHYSGLE